MGEVRIFSVTTQWGDTKRDKNRMFSEHITILQSGFTLCNINFLFTHFPCHVKRRQACTKHVKTLKIPFSVSPGSLSVGPFPPLLIGKSKKGAKDKQDKTMQVIIIATCISNYHSK